MSAPQPQHASAPRVPSLSTQAVVLISILAALVVGLIIGLVYLAGPDGRTDVLTWLTSVFVLVTGGVSTASVVQNRRIAGDVEQVRRQTNGVLDKRIRDGVRDVLADAGVPPQRRATDREG